MWTLCILGALGKFDLRGIGLPAGDYAFWGHWDCLACVEMFCLPAIKESWEHGDCFTCTQLLCLPSIMRSCLHSRFFQRCSPIYKAIVKDSLVIRCNWYGVAALVWILCILGIVARGAPFLTLGLCSICFRWKRTSG